ncbi:MAG: hypothetical protein WBH18_01370 [Lentibacter algarum]|uniref:hypothetical protein n=1 Tax=Lentibacter algarum TaxID=576131 RepID=UPI003C72C0CE
MKRILMTTTALVFGFCAQANAGTFEEAALDTFQEQGYSNIDVSTSGNRVNVQAVKEGVVVDITYDSDTGAVISQDASYADDNDSHDSNDSHDDNDGHDSNDSHESSDDDGRDGDSDGHDSDGHDGHGGDSDSDGHGGDSDSDGDSDGDD